MAGVRTSVAEYELLCTGDARRASEVMQGIEFANEEAYVLIIARTAAIYARNWERLAELLDIPLPLEGDLGPAFDALWRAASYQLMSREDDAAHVLVEASQLLADLDAENSLTGTYRYARVRLGYHALRGDTEATLHWMEEHRARVRQQLKGDKVEEVENQLLYADALVRIGHLEAAVDQLASLFGSDANYFSFVLIESDPVFDPIRSLPAYRELKEKYLRAQPE